MLNKIVYCLVFCLIASSAHAETALEQAAKTMQPGEWKLFSAGKDAMGKDDTSTDMNLSLLVPVGGDAGFIFGYADSMKWNNTLGQIMYAGGDHPKTTSSGPETTRFVVYDEVTKKWTATHPSWMPLTNNTAMHGYDHQAVSPQGHFFTRKGFGGHIMMRFAQNQWTELPTLDGLIQTTQCCGAMEYFPETNSLIFIQGGESNVGGGVFVFQEAQNQWTRLCHMGGVGGLCSKQTVNDLMSNEKYTDVFVPIGGYAGVAEYLPQHHVVVFGGGANSHALFKIDTNFKLTKLADFPIDVGYQGLGQRSVVTTDPNSGKLLVFDNDRHLYAYDLTTNQWEGPVQTPSFMQNLHGKVGGMIPKYGVNFIINCTGAATCNFYLYKHSQGTLPTDLAPATPKNLRTR